jgi:hypothetical protein
MSRSPLPHPPTNFFVDSEFMSIPPPELESVDAPSTKACTTAKHRESLDKDSPPKKKRMLNCAPIQQHVPSLRITYSDKYRQMLFPALSTQCDKVPGANRALFSPCSSLLTSMLSEAGVGITTRQRTTQIITNLLSEKYQTSLPASWASHVLENEESTSDYFTLPLRSFILREWSMTLYNVPLFRRLHF